MSTIESSTGYNLAGDIVCKRAADGLVWVVVDDSGMHGLYLCREYTHNAGRKHEQHYEWLSERNSPRFFASRDEAVAYAVEH